jgi:hypothetical protein
VAAFRFSPHPMRQSWATYWMMACRLLFAGLRVGGGGVFGGGGKMGQATSEGGPIHPPNHQPVRFPQSASQLIVNLTPAHTSASPPSYHTNSPNQSTQPTNPPPTTANLSLCLTHTHTFSLSYTPPHELLRPVVQQPREGLVGVDEPARGVQGVEEGERVGCLFDEVGEHLHRSWFFGLLSGRLGVCMRGGGGVSWFVFYIHTYTYVSIYLAS